ncbi:MAG TPA: hypothetical protein VMF30_07940, partial [Pirellulales bacterium]|nr:hypothetical protein [Pirellulales bacterium]
MKTLIVLTAVFSLSALVALVSPHQATAGDATGGSANAAADLTAKRTKVADEIAALTKTKPAPAAGQAPAVDPADEEIDLLGALDLVYVQIQAVGEHQTELGHIRERLQGQIDNLHKFGPPE